MIKYAGFFIFLLILVMSFQLADTANQFKRPPYRSYYLEKMEWFHASQKDKCIENALRIARLQVDSVLTGKKLLVEIDSFQLLPKPDKPDKPEFEFEVDSLPVEPLFDKE